MKKRILRKTKKTTTQEDEDKLYPCSFSVNIAETSQMLMYVSTYKVHAN